MSKTVHRTWRTAAGFLGALMAVTAYQAVTGCTTLVIPPANPLDAVVVSVVDYGRHVELVLPDGGGGSVVYTYGDWDYFALGKSDPWQGLLAVTTPTQGALGRRRDPSQDPAELFGQSPLGDVIELHVSEERVVNLLEKLEARFNVGIETRVYNQDYDLEFVKDPAKYTWCHNCNVAIADWLQQLGCELRGSSWSVDFVVEQPLEDRIGCVGVEAHLRTRQVMGRRPRSGGGLGSGLR